MQGFILIEKRAIMDPRIIAWIKDKQMYEDFQKAKVKLGLTDAPKKDKKKKKKRKKGDKKVSDSDEKEAEKPVEKPTEKTLTVFEQMDKNVTNMIKKARQVEGNMLKYRTGNKCGLRVIDSRRIRGMFGEGGQAGMIVIERHL